MKLPQIVLVMTPVDSAWLRGSVLLQSYLSVMPIGRLLLAFFCQRPMLFLRLIQRLFVALFLLVFPFFSLSAFCFLSYTTSLLLFDLDLLSPF